MNPCREITLKLLEEFYEELGHEFAWWIQIAAQARLHLLRCLQAVL